MPSGWVRPDSEDPGVPPTGGDSGTFQKDVGHRPRTGDPEPGKPEPRWVLVPGVERGRVGHDYSPSVSEARGNVGTKGGVDGFLTRPWQWEPDVSDPGGWGRLSPRPSAESCWVVPTRHP